MSDLGPEPDAARAKPRGEAAWKAHLQAVAESNDRAKSAGKRERREREDREMMQRKAQELRMEADSARNLDPRYTN
jgi:hypothetical protein